VTEKKELLASHRCFVKDTNHLKKLLVHNKATFALLAIRPWQQRGESSSFCFLFVTARRQRLLKIFAANSKHQQCSYEIQPTWHFDLFRRLSCVHQEANRSPLRRPGLEYPWVGPHKSTTCQNYFFKGKNNYNCDSVRDVQWILSSQANKVTIWRINELVYSAHLALSSERLKPVFFDETKSVIFFAGTFWSFVSQLY